MPEGSKSGSGILLRKATSAYQDLKYAVAAGYFESLLLNQNYSKQTILLPLADCYWQIRDYDKAEKIYKQLYPIISDSVSVSARIRIAEIYARKENYPLASEWLSTVAGYEEKAHNYGDYEYINEMRRDSADWKIGYLSINTPYREFSPYFKINTLLFSSNKAPETKQNANAWDGFNYTKLWEIPVSDIDTIDIHLLNDSLLGVSAMNDNRPKKLSDVYECGDTKPENSLLQLTNDKLYINADTAVVGSLVQGLGKLRFNSSSISLDKNNNIYFSTNYPKADKNGINRVRIMEGTYSERGVDHIKKMPFGNFKTHSVMHPTVNCEGTLLVCSSDKAGGQGGFDLYYSTRKDISAPWDTLKSFGNTINTIGNEVFPSITPNDYLFFSSDGLPGLGGLDIYKVRIKEALAYNSPEVMHIGYPLNSSADDFGWTHREPRIKRGFFTSDRYKVNDNLFSFFYDPKSAYFEGCVREKETSEVIPAATVFLYNTKENIVYVAKSNKRGKYRFPISNMGKIIVKAVEKKHSADCFTSRIVYDPQNKDTTFKAPRDLLLDKHIIGFSWRLKNTHYDFDKSEIRTDAVPVLDSLINLTFKLAITLDSLIIVMNNKPITIEIGSHTDSRGTFEYNNLLSEQRSKSVVKYLIAHGIDASRITSKGYGEYILLNKCSDGVDCTKEEHQANRRTEATITGFSPPQAAIESIDTDRFKDGDKISITALPAGFFDDCGN